MGLLVCPDCGGKVSDHAEACPHCGCPISIVMQMSSEDDSEIDIDYEDYTKKSYGDINQKPMLFNEECEPLKVVTGQTVLFGKFDARNSQFCEVDREKWNPIEWTVLDIKNNEALLISRYVISVGVFRTTYDDETEGMTTWESSYLRKYVNEYFYRDAFNDLEKKRIVPMLCECKHNRKYGTNSGEATIDRVTIPSIEDIELYSIQTKTSLTQDAYDYCEKHNLQKNGWPKLDCKWWLRNMGQDNNYAMCIDRNGDVNYYGQSVSPIIRYRLCQEEGVRPMIKIII